MAYGQSWIKLKKYKFCDEQLTELVRRWIAETPNVTWGAAYTDGYTIILQLLPDEQRDHLSEEKGVIMVDEFPMIMDKIFNMDLVKKTTGRIKLFNPPDEMPTELYDHNMMVVRYQKDNGSIQIWEGAEFVPYHAPNN